MPTDPEARRRQIRRERIFFGTILVLVVLASAGLIAWNAYVRHVIAGTSFIPKREKITPEAKLLQEYVRIDTSHQNEIDGARWIGAQLAREHLPFEIFESASKRGNLYARIRGKKPGDALMLLSHIDVVPASPAGWTRPPFSGDIALNQIWGRGTLDMKSVTICELEAFIAIAKKGTPERDVVLLAVADEESGSAFGMRWIIEHRPDILEGVKYAINEGGITETLDERVTYYGVEVGTKQLVQLDLLAPTREQLRQARIALEPHFISADADVVLPEVVRYFHEIAPFRFEPRDELIDLQRTVKTGQVWKLPRGYRELVQNVVWATGVRKEGDGWAMRIMLLNVPGVAPEPRVEWLTTTVAPFGVRPGPIVSKDPVAPLSSDQTPLYKVITEEASAAYETTAGPQILTRSENDSRFLRPLGIACYGMWPFPVDFFQTNGIHRTDERVRLDWFAEGVTMMEKIVMRFAFMPH